MTDISTNSPVLVVAGLIPEDQKILIAQRPEGSWMEGFWEFPGGKVHAGEDPRAALQRELLEEIGVVCRVGEIEEVIHHSYPDKTVLLLFYWCQILEGDPKAMEGQALKWVSIEELEGQSILPADMPLIQKLSKRDCSPDPKHD